MRTSYAVAVESVEALADLPNDQKYKRVVGVLKKSAKKLKIVATKKSVAELAAEIRAELAAAPNPKAALKLLPPKSKLTKDEAMLRDVLAGSGETQLVEVSLVLTQIHPDQHLPPTSPRGPSNQLHDFAVRLIGDATESNGLTKKYGPTPWTKAPRAQGILVDAYLHGKRKAGRTDAGDPLVSARIELLSQSPWIDHLEQGMEWDSAAFW